MQDREELARINEKLDGLKSTVEEMKSGLWKRVEDHSKRLPVIEDRVSDLRRLWWYIISAILGLCVSAVWAAVSTIRRG